MSEERTVRWALDERQGLRDIRQCLAGVRSLRIMAPTVATRRVMDSFDWRLYRKGGVIEEIRQRGRTGTGWRELWSDRLDTPLLRGDAPRFARDFPSGALRQYLLSILDVRALIPLVDIEHHCQEILVLNANEKTVAWLFLEHAMAGRPGGSLAPLPSTLRLQPLKGYEKHFRRVRKCLEQELKPVVVEEPLVATALAAIGRQPMDYSSKLDIPLVGDMPAQEAVRSILRSLFETMEINEQGVIHDIDTEFLHDFRVAVRRTRCALKQLGSVLPARDAERFLARFSWLGSITGAARDLDVYMLHLEAYEAALPQHLQAGLAPLRELLAGKLKREKQTLAEQLRSSRYHDFKEEYRAFLEAPSGGGVAIAELAKRRIGKMFKRVLREGRAIRGSSPPEALHELRKSCKKLRYLLEFFLHLYGRDKVKRLVRILKTLQDNLGELQDLAVQMAALRHSRAELEAGGALPAVSRQAMEMLVEQLQQRHDAARMAFAKRFRKFASAKNRHRFEKLFEGEPS